MENARQEIKPIAEEFGKERVASACEALVEISVQGKDSVARLKPHIRRMAFQILGAETTADASTSTVASDASTPTRKPEAPPPQQREKKTRKKPAAPSAPSVPTRTSDTSSDSPIMQQYRAAKEKHPGMLLVFRNVAK